MTRTRFEMAELLADPHGALCRARGGTPVVQLELGAGGIMTHARVRGLLADGRLRGNLPEFLRTFGVSSGPFYDWLTISALNREDAAHQCWRKLVARTFTPRSVERLRPFLRTAAHALIDGFAARGGCEIVAEFADLYPSLGLSELIGVPPRDRERFRGWANTIGLGFGPLVAQHIDAVDAALTELLAYAGELAALRRTAPRDDLITRIAYAAQQGGWSDAEVEGTIALLVFAGHETTKNQLGSTIAIVAEHPHVWDALAAGTLTAAAVVEEALRRRGTVTFLGRRVTEPVALDGEMLAAGEEVYLSLWSANRDEAVYRRPDVFDPNRDADPPHLAFGHGPHYCIGAALARAELQEALLALTSRLCCPAIAADAVWRPPFGLHGPERLPLAFTARPRATVTP